MVCFIVQITMDQGARALTNMQMIFNMVKDENQHFFLELNLPLRYEFLIDAKLDS